MRGQSAGKSVGYFGLPAANCLRVVQQSQCRPFDFLEFAAAHESENGPSLPRRPRASVSVIGSSSCRAAQRSGRQLMTQLGRERPWERIGGAQNHIEESLTYHAKFCILSWSAAEGARIACSMQFCGKSLLCLWPRNPRGRHPSSCAGRSGSLGARQAARCLPECAR